MAAASIGYQGFGSFHSDNIEELISVPASEYSGPPLPFDIDPIFADIENVRGAPQQRTPAPHVGVACMNTRDSRWYR